MKMISHIFAWENEPLPPISSEFLYEYVMSRYGLFIRAKRKNLSVTLQVSLSDEVTGLAGVLDCFSIPSKFPYLKEIMLESWKYREKERLFYGLYDNQWTYYRPRQVINFAQVRPYDPYDPKGNEALIEIHSHGNLHAGFSPADNKDETGFKLYTIVGNFSFLPQIITRVGIYGHYFEIPSSWVYDPIPSGVVDLFTAEM